MRSRWGQRKVSVEGLVLDHGQQIVAAAAGDFGRKMDKRGVLLSTVSSCPGVAAEQRMGIAAAAAPGLDAVDGLAKGSVMSRDRLAKPLGAELKDLADLGHPFCSL